MDSIYRALIPVAFWLGLAAFVLALVMMVVARPFLFGLTPGGILRAAQALFLATVGGHCARRTTLETRNASGTASGTSAPGHGA